MRRFGCITALFAFTVAGPLQTRNNAQNDDHTNSQTLAPQSPSAQSSGGQSSGGLIRRTTSAEQLKREENRITLDLQVTDPSGKPVAGLREQDITLLDRGRPVPITSFREFDARQAQPPAELVLLIDVMNASFQDVVLERQGVERFLRQNGGRLALPTSIVFLADTGVKINQPSQDGESLARDLKKLQTPMRVLNPAQGAGGAEDRAQRSLRALQQLSTYEAPRPGRKLLLWVGPGWPLLSRLTADLSDLEQNRYFHSIVGVTTDLRRAHITLYSVAPLNLDQAGGQNPFLYQTYLKGVERPAQADSANLALQVLAVHSGGLVLSKSGDLAGQIALCAADGQGYYEITFDAAEDDAAIQYHALQVKSGQPGAVARTATAYYSGLPQSLLEAAPHPPPAAVPQLLRARTRLVLVDVTVLDQQGEPVRGLSSSDFLLREDNAPEKIVGLEEHNGEHSGDSSGERGASPPPSGAVPDTAVAPADSAILVSNKLPSGAIWNVLLVDLYNTPNDARSRLQEQLERFLQQLPEHEPVALVAMSNRIKIETSFQDGAGAAYRYLRKNGLGPVDPSTPANIVERQEVQMPSADLSGSAIANQANIDVDRQAARAKTTLECLSALAQWLTPYPGRKNVYWLSGGFPLQGQPFGVAGYSMNTPGLGPDTKGGHPLPMQQKTDQELESARVAIYPVDVRGIAAPDYAGITSADSTYSGNVGIVAAKDDDLTAARRSEMLEIAKSTGGTARFGNGIAQALRDGFNQANSYYTIAYTPPDTPPESESHSAYRRIQLSVDRPGTQLIYREGYYARNAAAESKPTPEQFKDSLRLNAPSELAVQFTSKITRSGEQATAEYGVEPATVDFQEDASGQLLADIDFAILEYDAKGKLLERSLVRLSGKMTPQQRARLTAKTLATKQTIALKRGARTLVLGVRDRVSGRFGNLEASVPAR